VSRGRRDTSGESMRTIVIALLVNLAVAVIKAIAGVLTASAGLLAEAAHSVGDCTTELFLMTAVRRSKRTRSRRHPFGYGKERYFWSLLAALTIFLLGAGFSIYQGLKTIFEGESDAASPWVGYIVIVLSAIVEGASLLNASRSVRNQSRSSRMSIRAYVRDPDDPTVKSVFLEDSAALIGLSFAALGLLLRQLTGSSFWDGLAALAIGALLIVVAYELARTNVALLIGKQANPKLVADLRETLERHPDVLAVIDVVTMMMGTGQILVCARVDYDDALSSADAERVTLELHEQLIQRFPDIEDVFLEAAPHSDLALRAQAAQRDGRVRSSGS
jgi:cation diffusion facilitator family transporter